MPQDDGRAEGEDDVLVVRMEDQTIRHLAYRKSEASAGGEVTLKTYNCGDFKLLLHV